MVATQQLLTDAQLMVVVYLIPLHANLLLPIASFVLMVAVFHLKLIATL
jgi:hypothetical protein